MRLHEWLPGFSALLVATLAASARADDPLTFWSDGESHLKATIQLDAAFFAEDNAWFDEDDANAGGDVDTFAELGAIPGLEAVYSLGKSGTLRGRVSGVWTTTQLGLDAAGSNGGDHHPSDITLEDAYIGWSSGDLFPSLGKDALDLSIGSQKYQVGSGFLFWDGATDGGSEVGGWWLGMRKAFEFTAIAKLQTGGFQGRVVYLKPDDDPDTSTDIFGVDFEYAFGERGMLGGGYWAFADSENLRRDGLDVFDLRGSVKPLDVLPGLSLAAELVYERNGDLNESWGGYAEVAHAFEQTRWKPTASYRFAHFTGDRGDADQIEAFDPIFYGFADWSSWYVGELFGGFIATNRNVDIHTLRLTTQPAESLKVQAVWSYFRLDELATELQPRLFDPRVVNIRDKDLGHELDLIADWSMNDHLIWSFVVGSLFPLDGLEQATGGNSVWTHFMLYASVSF